MLIRSQLLVSMAWADQVRSEGCVWVHWSYRRLFLGRVRLAKQNGSDTGGGMRAMSSASGSSYPLTAVPWLSGT